MTNLKPIILTFVQYVCILFLLILNPWFSENILLLCIEIIGIALGFWSIAHMSKSRLNISPTPLEGAILIQSGPYKILRHPMYLALILVFVPMLISNYSFWAIILSLIFFTNLALKMLYEEKLLSVHFKKYNEYSNKTWRLIPFVY